MRRIAVPLALMTFAVALPAAAFDPIDTDRRALLDHLERTRALFTNAVAGLTPEQTAWKQAEDRWAVAEVAEHLAVSEDVIRQMVAGEHPAFGNLDAIGWVYFLSGHTERHTLQIEEVKAAPGFPAG